MSKVSNTDLTKIIGRVLKTQIIPSRAKSLEPLVIEFFSALAMASISFRPAGDIQTDWKAAKDAASKSAALAVAVKRLTPHGRKSITFALKDVTLRDNKTNDVGDIQKILDALSNNLWRLSDKWKKENDDHRASDMKGNLLANWSIVFYERLTGEVATGTNAAVLNRAIFKLFAHETKGSPGVHLKKAITNRRRLEKRWSSQAA